MLKIIETLVQFFVRLIQISSEVSLKLVKFWAFFLKTDLGKLLIGEMLSGYMITPLSLLSDFLWSIAGWFIFRDSKFEKWIMSVAMFPVGILLSALGAPDWCQIFLPTIIIAITIFIQSKSQNTMFNNGKRY